MDARLYDELWNVEARHWWFQARRHIVWSLVRRYMELSAPGSAGGLPSDHGVTTEKPPAEPGAAAHTARLRICELGCGTGGSLAAAADRHDVVGVECSPHALRYARQRLGGRVIRGSLPDDVDLPPGFFDVVLLTDVLEHIEDDAASAKTALRLVRPGGIVVATVPAYQWLYSPRDAAHHHFRRYSKRRFGQLWAGRDAELLLLSHYNTLLFPPAAATRLATKLLPRRVATGDLTMPPMWLNRFLARIMRSEANLLGRIALPFGLSIIAVVRKRRCVQYGLAA